MGNIQYIRAPFLAKQGRGLGDGYMKFIKKS